MTEPDKSNVTNMSDHKGEGLLKYTLELGEEIKKAADKIKRIKANNKSNNSKKAEIRETLESKGISKKAFDFALKLYEMDSAELSSIQFALTACMEALSVKPGTLEKKSKRRWTD